MEKIKSLTVKLGSRSYPIIIGRGNLSDIGKAIKKLNLGVKGLLVTNPKVKLLYAKPVLQSLKKAGFEIYFKTVPDGEKYKSFHQLKKIYDVLINHHFERNSFIVTLGGGVIGDLAGFAAASYARGIPYIQVPTSLLAQVDSSVGGKVAINHPLGKNMIGAFYQPKLVLIDLELLTTLPFKQLQNGLAEVVKYGVIWDSRLFKFLEKHTRKILHYDLASLEYLVYRSCQIKAQVVSSDEREKHLRTILNFGHTLGHALESLEGYRKLSHGQAISIGMVFAANLTQKMKQFSRKDYERLVNLLKRIGLPTELKVKKANNILPYLFTDKKVKRGKIRFVLPQKIGKVFVRPVASQVIRKAIQK